MLIQDGNSEHAAHPAWRKIGIFREQKSRYIQMPQTDKKKRLLLTCLPFSELPFDISTVCQRNSDPILYSKLVYKLGHYFLDI